MSSAPASAPQATGRQIARGAGWMMLFKLADKSVGLVSTLILARLLLPADFGLVAMAMAVVALTQLMSALGFDTALIQRQDADRRHYDTAWTFNVLAGTCIAVVIWALAVPAGSFYRDDRLVAILSVLAMGSLVGGFENVGTIAFRKELDFRSEFRFLLMKRLVSFVVTIGLAVTLESYWALVIGVVTGRFASVWISYKLHPYRPKFCMSAKADLLNFSKWILISSLINFLHTRSTDFVLGRTVGPHGLGVYNIGSEIAALPSTEMIAPLNRAVYPAYARLGTEISLLRARFLQVFGVICLLGFPVSMALFNVAEPAVHVVLGERWVEAIPIIRIFILVGLLSALLSNLFLVVMAIGQPQAITMVSAAQLSVSLPAVIWASLHYGVVGAATAHLVGALFAAVGTLIFFLRISGVRAREMMASAWRPMLATLIMSVCMNIVDHVAIQLWMGIPHVIRLAVLLSTAGLAYTVCLWSLWKLSGAPASAEALVLQLIQERRAALWPLRPM